MACQEFRPDHNGECLNCDEWLDAHSLEVQLKAAERSIDMYMREMARMLRERDDLRGRVVELELALEVMQKKL